MVHDGPTPRFQYQIEEFKTEIVEITLGEFDVQFSSDQTFDGGWSLPGIERAVTRALRDPKVDIVIATGLVSSYLLTKQKRLHKPVIGTAIIDIAIQGVPFLQGISGVDNLNYLTSPKSFERDVQEFREIVEFEHLSILVTDTIIQAIPELRSKVTAAAHQYGIQIDLISVGADVPAALSDISAQTDAVSLTPLFKLENQGFEQLVDGINQRKLPSYSLWGRDEVEAGVMASVAPPSDETRVARRLAINLSRILLGENAAELPVNFSQGERLTINMETVRKIDYYPSWTTLSRAELINEEVTEGVGRLTLADAVNLSIKVNLDILVAQQRVHVTREDINQARSQLLPQIDSSLRGAIQDEGLANTINPERSATGSVTLSQLIYSDSAWANLRISGKLHQAEQSERDSVRLDIILATASAYLNILRSKTNERVRKDNVRRSRANLELAQVREYIGYSSRADVFRWESEIATDRREVLDAEAVRRQAEVELNRLLDQPQESLFTTAAAELDDPLLLLSDPRFFDYVDNPKTYRTFRDFMTLEGLAQAPELAALDAGIDAQKRNVVTAKRDFWVPDVSLDGGYSNTFARGGVGGELPPGVGDDGWNVGVTARLPIFTSGGRNSALRQTQQDLIRLKYQRDSLRDSVEARIRSALHRAGASYPSIQLAREGAEAANSNLELVTHSYTTGAVSIIDLIDAQNVALSADLSTANAVYDFLLDYMAVQRAIGQFDFFLEPADREAWYQRIAEYFSAKRVEPRR